MSNFGASLKSINSRRWILLVLAFVVGFGIPWALLGPHFSESLSIVPYEKGKPLYSDRDYANVMDTPVLAGAKVVLIERHRMMPIWIHAESKITVYRMITSANDNTDFLEYEDIDADVHAKGITCTMDRLVRMDFSPGLHELPEGGPVAASPLLFVGDGEVTATSRYSLLRMLAK